MLKLFKFCILLSFIYIGFALFSMTVLADTIVNSDITGNTHWTTKGSPYLIYSEKHDIIVERGATLKIDPGVVVKFNVDTGLTINGKIDAHGNPDEMITFTSIYDNGTQDIDTAYGGDWYGIIVRGEGSVFKHVHIKYAGRDRFTDFNKAFGIMLSGYNTHFTNSVVEKSGGNGVYLLNYYKGLFHNNLVQNNEENGIVIVHSETDLFRNIVQNNKGSGVVIENRVNSDYTTRRLTLHSNFIQRNGKDGIYLDTLMAPNIHDNDIHHNAESGIDIKRGYPWIRHNAIYSNGDGVTIEYNWPLEITHNDFKNNELYGIRVENFMNKYSGVKAENNWWGGTGGPNNEGNDSASTGIDYSNWLSENVSKFFVNQKYNQNSPAVPKHLRGYSDGKKVTLYWQANSDDDFLAYHIYKSYSENGGYERIASTTQDYFIDYEYKLGKTNYYKISAVDFSGNESVLSGSVDVNY